MDNHDLYYISQRSGWSEDKIRFFLKNKIHTISGALRADISWPEQYIHKVESLNHFSLFDNLSYEQMCQYVENNEKIFSEATALACSDIEHFPHQLAIYEHDFSQEKCMIMVDASLKKNGKEYFAGIAGCIRTLDGTIVCGFAKELEQAHELNSREIELLSIKEGIDIARTYGLKNYQIVSDCIGNVYNIHRAMAGITPSTDDFINNRHTFEMIASQLKEDDAKAVYVPRNYNNIADEFSKTFYRRQAEIFNLKKTEIYQKSNQILAGVLPLTQATEEIYFSHPKQLLFNQEKNPYNMDKNSHLDYGYVAQEHGDYDYFFMPIYNRADKKFYNFFVNLKDETVSLASVRNTISPDNALINILSNLAGELKQFDNNKVAIFIDTGVCATINRLTPVKEEYLPQWQELYQSLDYCSQISFFKCANSWMNKAKVHMKNYREATSTNSFI